MDMKMNKKLYEKIKKLLEEKIRKDKECNENKIIDARARETRLYDIN